MSKSNQAFDKLYHEQLDAAVDAEAGQNFSTALQQDSDLRQDYEEFGELIQLLNALPRPQSDPDFALKVQRRIARRQRSRRRARRQQPALPFGMGAISTLVTLLVVMAIALATHPLGLQVQSLSSAAPSKANKLLFLQVQTDATTLQTQLESMQQKQQILAWTQLATGLQIDINSDQLAHLLQAISSLGALQISAEKSAQQASKHVDIQVKLVL